MALDAPKSRDPNVTRILTDLWTKLGEDSSFRGKELQAYLAPHQDKPYFDELSRVANLVYYMHRCSPSSQRS